MGRIATWSIILAVVLLGSSCGTSVDQPISTVTTVAEVKLTEPLVAVLPHHDLVQTQRQELLAVLSERSQPETIILISPNHFAAGDAAIQTTDHLWILAGGSVTIQPDVTVINHLVAAGVASLEDAPFENEHGIKNILADLHTAFPNSAIVPLILKDSVRQEDIQELSYTLSAVCSACGLIASVDMSHYNPAAVADIHDIKTLRALQTQDVNDIWNTEVDSQPALALLLAWAQYHKTEHFVQTDHTNSGTLLNNPDGETTSHILGYFTAKQTAVTDIPNQSLTFTFAGDVMLGREIGYQFQNNNYQDLFTNFGHRIFWGTDISWLNMEGPISDHTIIQDRQPDDLIFLFSKEAVAVVDYLQLTTVGLANNHTANQGRSGLDTTRQMIAQTEADWVGDPSGINEASVKRYRHGGMTVSLIAVNVFDGDLTGLTELITQEDLAGNVVVVLPHWGNEYQTTHSSRQEQLARDWFVAGADLVIGMHPHVVQDAQVIQQKLVIYSLGNFIFDQTFSKETQQGLIVTGSVSGDELHLVLMPIVSRNLKPEIAHGQERQDLIDRICVNIQAYCQADTIRIGR